MTSDVKLTVAERESLAGLIHRHEYDVLYGTVRHGCACGWETDDAGADPIVHSEHVADLIEDHFAALIEARLTEQRNGIAAAIEALPGPDEVGIKGWPASDREAYLLGIEEASARARDYQPEEA